MEDYFFDIDEQVEKDKVFVLVIYDIADNKRRSRLVKFLKGYGFRIQKSAFEAIIRVNMYGKMVSEIGKYATAEDNIRVYKIVGKGQVLNFGKEMEVTNEDIIII